jgi:hypothetical protein
MKYIIVIAALALSGCGYVQEAFYGKPNPCKSDLRNCTLIRSDWSLRALDEDCSKLAKCMKLDYEIVFLPGQPHDPHACSVTHPKKKWVSHYYYPKGRISFGEVSYDRLSEAIATCEMMTETGDKSKSYYDGLMAAFDKMDKERAERKRQMDEAERPKPAVKVRVVK